MALDRNRFIPSLGFLLTMLLPIVGYAQNPCAVPQVSLKPKGETIFSPQQEGYLGDIVADQLSLGKLVYPQTELTEHLDRITARLLKYLPENEYKFQFSLMEMGEV